MTQAAKQPRRKVWAGAVLALFLVTTVGPISMPAAATESPCRPAGSGGAEIYHTYIIPWSWNSEEHPVNGRQIIDVCRTRTNDTGQWYMFAVIRNEVSVGPDLRPITLEDCWGDCPGYNAASYHRVFLNSNTYLHSSDPSGEKSERQRTISYSLTASSSPSATVSWSQAYPSGVVQGAAHFGDSHERHMYTNLHLNDETDGFGKGLVVSYGFLTLQQNAGTSAVFSYDYEWRFLHRVLQWSPDIGYYWTYHMWKITITAGSSITVPPIPNNPEPPPDPCDDATILDPIEYVQCLLEAVATDGESRKRTPELVEFAHAG